jgi:PAS domain S-box-containing protein
MTASPALRSPRPILIVDDRSVDRKYLGTLLRSAGYDVIEAFDGGEALGKVAESRPALVISDILMPTLDGFEFVRRMRDDLGIVDIPVIFYTATYHEREARVLADLCGVVEVLVKPSAATVILAAVDRVLASPPVAQPTMSSHTFTQGHSRVMRSALTSASEELEISRQRLSAIVDLVGRLAEQPDPVARIMEVGRAIREVTFAQTAALGVVDDDRLSRRVWWTGCDETLVAHLGPPDRQGGLLRALLTEQRPVRRRNDSGLPEALGLPAGYPRTYSILAVPIASSKRVLGWICLLNKLGLDEFSAADEQIAITIGTHAGISYENARLYADLLERTASMEAEVRERRRAEVELMASRERIQFALAAARMVVFAVDLKTGLMTWSGDVEVIQGRSADEVPSRLEDAVAMVHPDDRPGVAAGIQVLARDGSDFAMEFRTVWPDGSLHWLDIRARPLPDAEGRPARALGVVIDVDARHLLEAQFHQAQKLEAVGQLAGGLAHDFNNLLTAILGYANLLEMAIEPGDPRLDDVAEIIRAAQRAAALTRQLLALSRREVRQPTIVNLNTLVSESLQMLRRLLPESIDATANLEPALWQVRADVSQMEQVIMNLAVNARDAMPSGGRVRIETANTAIDEHFASQRVGVSPGDYVRLSVSDTGVGMTDEVKERLFEPFFTTKEHGKGSGLGLATVHGIVKQSGGHIWVYSEQGRGSTFKVYLPRADGVSLEERKADATEPATGTGTVLVVEDERAVRFLTRTILTRLGYEVFEAAGPAEAMAWAVGRGEPVDLLLSDVVMPGESGPELHSRLAVLWPGLKVLFMSGYTDDSVARERLVEPGVAFLQKPFTADDLSRKVREVMER